MKINIASLNYCCLFLGVRNRQIYKEADFFLMKRILARSRLLSDEKNSGKIDCVNKTTGQTHKF